VKFNYIDTHVHFWDPGLYSYEWLKPLSAIQHRHCPPDLQTETGPRFPEQIVFVECGAPALEEVQWIERLSSAEPRIAGIVAHCRMNAGTATAAALAELGRRPLVRGVRHLLQDETDPAYCLSSEFVAGVQRLPAAGLSFDICCYHHQLPFVIKLARSCPETAFVLDHLGKPDIRAGQIDPWRRHLAALSALPNVDCKLSGLVTEADHQTWTAESLRPYVAHALDVFGPTRLLFGSDWPVVKRASSYSHWIDTVRHLVAHLPVAEQRAIFVDTARRVYRLG